MELTNLKEQLNKAGFSEEVLASLNLILDAAIVKGSLSEEDQVKMAGIIDQEIEQAKTQASVMEEIAFGLDEYAGELELADKIAEAKTRAVEADFDSEMDDLEEQVKDATAPVNSPTATPAAQ